VVCCVDAFLLRWVGVFLLYCCQFFGSLNVYEASVLSTLVSAIVSISHVWWPLFDHFIQSVVLFESKLSLYLLNHSHSQLKPDKPPGPPPFDSPTAVKFEVRACFISGLFG